MKNQIKRTDLNKLQELFEQRMYIENLNFDYISEEEIDKALKKVEKEIKETLEKIFN